MSDIRVSPDRLEKIDIGLMQLKFIAMQERNETAALGELLRPWETAMTLVPVTSADLDGAEVSWFSALCSDDYEFLGVPNGDLRSS